MAALGLRCRWVALLLAALCAPEVGAAKPRALATGSGARLEQTSRLKLAAASSEKSASTSADIASSTSQGSGRRPSVPQGSWARLLGLRPFIEQFGSRCAVMLGAVGACRLLYLLKQQSSEATQSSTQVGLLFFAWLVMSVGKTVLNKIVAETLKSPAMLAAVQMALGFIFVGAASGNKLWEAPPQQLRKWLCVPILYSAMLCTSMCAFERLSLSLLTVVRNLQPIAMLLVECLVMPPELRPTVNGLTIAGFLAMLAGALIYGQGVLSTVSLAGVAYAVLNMVFSLAEKMVQRRLLVRECRDLPVEACMVLNNGLGLVPALGLALARGEVGELSSAPARAAAWTDPRTLALLVLFGLAGVGLCYFGLRLQRAVSATAFAVSHNLSKAAVICAGVGLFGDPIGSPSAAGGLALSMAGSVLYGAAQTTAAGGPPGPSSTKAVGWAGDCADAGAGCARAA